MSRRATLLAKLARLATDQAALAAAQAAALTELATLEGGVANDTPAPAPAIQAPRALSRRGPRVVSTARLAGLGESVQLTEVDRKAAEKKLRERGMLRQEKG